MMHRRSLAYVLMSCALLSTGLVRISLGQVDEPTDKPVPFNFEEASRDVLKPREIYPYVKRDIVPMDLKIISDEIVPSDTDPSKQLRKIVAKFNSLELAGKTWGPSLCDFHAGGQTPQSNSRSAGQGRDRRLAPFGLLSDSLRQVR